MMVAAGAVKENANMVAIIRRLCSRFVNRLFQDGNIREGSPLTWIVQQWKATAGGSMFHARYKVHMNQKYRTNNVEARAKTRISVDIPRYTIHTAKAIVTADVRKSRRRRQWQSDSIAGKPQSLCADSGLGRAGAPGWWVHCWGLRQPMDMRKRSHCPVRLRR
ncbi:hypothetical protein PanNE5_30480 [Pandoraea sp. NE5]|nr:hypothetical protein PanNE5_30480 [Pandoraea sp. NE5]